MWRTRASFAMFSVVFIILPFFILLERASEINHPNPSWYMHATSEKEEEFITTEEGRRKEKGETEIKRKKKKKNRRKACTPQFMCEGRKEAE
jgi:hypothetical protein